MATDRPAGAVMADVPDHSPDAEVRDWVQQILRDWVDNSPEATERFLAAVAENFTGHGTGPGDYYANKDDLRAMVLREHAGMSLPFTLEVPRLLVRLQGEDSALVEGQIRVEIDAHGETLVESPRFTFAAERTPGREWRLVHFHFSVPDMMQQEGDTMDDLLWSRNRELERLVNDRTAELAAAHREARIDAALERLRARTAEMLRSDELADVAVALFRELESLGIQPRRCGFAVRQEDGAWQFHHTTHSGQAIERAGVLTEPQVPFFADVFEAWRGRQRPSATITFAGDDLQRVIHLLLEQTDVTLPDAAAEVARGTYPEQVCFNFFFFSQGALLAHTLVPLKSEERGVLERFADVFDLAYARYQDFRRLEAKSREIETALEQLRATQEQLVQREKLASLGQLTAGIAHEIKNPLNFINNFAGLARELVAELDETDDPTHRREVLADLVTNTSKIEEHGRRADAIVRQMMEHARSGSGERRTISLNALVDEYANHAYHALRVRRPGFSPDVTFDLSDDVGDIDVVPQEIGRVIINLVDNAFDAVRDRASSEATNYRPTVRVSTRRVAHGAEVRVEDNGAGMAEPTLSRVFEPFFTTKPAGEGTGLGLSLAYDIVTQGHRGTLTVESEAGRGTAFSVTLPAA